MKSPFKIVLASLLGFVGALGGRAQQQPVMAVSIEAVNVGGSVDSTVTPYGTAFTGGTTFNPPNESYGTTGTTISVSAVATGTFLQSSFSYSFFVNGISIGKTTQAVPPPARAVVQWAPPQPGAYFITVVADDGTNSATSLPVRYFATGTVVNSPSNNTLVPQGSTVVLKGDATPPGGFIKRIDFYDNGTLIGSDSTAPYSFIYTVPGAVGSPHAITAKAYDNNDAVVGGTNTVNLQVINKIDVGTTSVISAPANGANITVPSGSSSIPISVDANSTTGRVNKVELYLDGTLLATTNNPKFSFPYTFTWLPTIVGDYTLVALTYDDKNNVIASAPAVVHIVPPPTVTVTSPTAGSTVIGGTPTAIKAVASDSGGSGITSVQFFVDTVFVGQSTTPTVPGGNEYQTLATFTQKTNSDGIPLASVISAIAINALGSSGVSPSVSVGVTSGGGGGGGTSVGSPPVVNVTSPAASSQLPVNQPVFIGAAASDTDGNILSVQFFANNAPIGAATTKYPYNTTWTPTSLGTYKLTAKVTDNDGNAVTSSAVVVSVVDPAPGAPTVSISSPTSGSTVVVGAAQTLRANATDAVSVASVQFFVNGQSQGPLVTSFPFTTSWTPATPGIYTITARATNASGNQTTSAPATIVVSGGVAPTVGITSPSSGFLTTAGLSVTLSANAFDSDGTVAGVRFLVNGTPVGTTLANPPYTVSWTPSSGGIYTVVAEATDNVGNITNSSPIIVNVAANSLPTVAVVSPANGSTVRVNAGTVIKATASDSDGTIASVQFFVNGVSLGSVTTFPYQTTWTPSAEGVYRLTAVATDNTGAITTSSTVLAIGSATSGDTVATGSYQGVGSAGGIENGNFALISAIGKTAAFIGYSTTSGANRAYFYSTVPVSSTGSYSLADSAGKNLISGLASETGTSGTLDSARLAFIGPDVLTSGSVLTSALYSGTLTGKTSSKVAAILGADGSIIFYVLDGSFEDASGGGFTGKVDGTGAFNLLTMRGNRITGKVDLSTRVLTGSLSGADTGQFSIAPTSLSAAAAKVTGSAMQVGFDVVHPQTHNTYDQILLQGPSATITADPGQITRLSYVDTSLDIVQVEFSGAGSLSITLDNYSGPASAANYDQPDVQYVKGHAGIVINGADETTNLSIFSVGRANAVDQSIFKSGVKYDGIADLAYVVILTTDGKFGGLRAGDASFFATKGLAGICAPGVQFTGPVYVNDISAADTANPMLLFSSAPDVRVTGGDLWQSNGQPLQIGGVSELKFTDGTNSAGDLLPAQNNKARLQQNGVDVAGLAVMQPAP